MNQLQPVKGAAKYESGTDKGKPCVWMTVFADENCSADMYYVVQHCRTMDKARERANWWQAKENKSVIKNPPIEPIK